MTNSSSEPVGRPAAAPLCDLGLLIKDVVDAHRLSPEANVRHVDQDLPSHPLLVRGHGEDVASLVAAAIECVARWPGVNRRIVVRARLIFERVELLVGHGNSKGGDPPLPITLSELGSDGDPVYVSLRGRMMRLLRTLNATLVLGWDVALDALVLSIVFPGISGGPTYRSYRPVSG